MGIENLNPHEELKKLDEQIKSATELAALKPIYYRINDIIRTFPDDFDVQFSGNEIKQRLMARDTLLKQRKVSPPAPPAPLPPAMPTAEPPPLPASFPGTLASAFQRLSPGTPALQKQEGPLGVIQPESVYAGREITALPAAGIAEVRRQHVDVDCAFDHLATILS